MGNILVISADTHAGLPDAEYKNYLATQYHEAFEDDLRARHAAGDAVRQSMGADDNEFVQEWYEENEEGLARRLGRRPARQGARRRRRRG